MDVALSEGAFYATPSELAQKHADFLLKLPEDSRRRSYEVTASFNLDALESEATRLVGKECSVQVVAIHLLIARLNRSRGNADVGISNELLEHRVASEAATLKYVRRTTDIPVPEVYAVESRSDNPVGARYILQERIIGQPLAKFYDSMTDVQLERVVLQVADYEAQLLCCHFPMIGSLIEDTSAAAIRMDRMGHPRILDYARPENSGPWPSSHEFLKAYVRAELELLEGAPETWQRERAKNHTLHGDSDGAPLEYMISWYRLLQKGIYQWTPAYPRDDEPSQDAPFVLRHIDLSVTNIMVAFDDPTRVVGIIDWEGACVVPLWSTVLGNGFLGSLPRDHKLHKLRRDIHISREPAVWAAIREGSTVRSLFYLVAFHYSIRRSPKDLNAMFMESYQYWPKSDADAFQELVDFIQSTNDHIIK
ncbi:hypothetical protein BU17DRAFT_62756 [Hysterangium stoloniferum]|nr:hypothetical protein BU17DRAFT_62756 [Hysterangium stoloniferum]